MKYLSGLTLALGGCLASIMSLLHAGSLPERVPVHWNLAGQVDRYGSKWEGLLVMPITMMVLSAVFTLVAFISGNRLRANTIKALNIVALAISFFFLILHRALISGDAVQIVKLMPLLLPCLMIVLGFSIRDIEPNPFIGIRLPWTMNSSVTWRKTHERASKLWIRGGAIGLICGAFGLPMGVSIAVFIACLLYPLFDSYKISRTF